MSQAGSQPRLLLIDGHSMAFRAFYALPETMTTTTGQPVNAVYGFMAMLARLLETEQPTHVAVAFDVGSHTFRTDRFPDYKGTRSETPPAFLGQIPLIKEVLLALNISALEKPEYEADDILATLADQGNSAGMEVLVCSGDRDTYQLITDNVTVLYPIKGVSELKRMTPTAVFDKYAVTPTQYPDLAALVGETSDNIPGVPGVGPKTAAKWLTQYGDLVTLLDNATGITGKVGIALRDNIEQVRLNREINALRTDVELPLAALDTGLRGFDRIAVHELADALQWGGLRDRLLKLDPGSTSDPAPTERPNPEMELVSMPSGGLAAWLATHSGATVGVGAPVSKNPAPVSTPTGAAGSSESQVAAVVAMAVAGVGKPVDADAWLVALTPLETSGDSQPVLVLDLRELPDADATALETWLADAQRPKILHGAKSAAHALSARGLPLVGVQFDTELAAYLCFPDSRNYELEELSLRLLGRTLAAGGDGQGQFDFGDGSANDRSTLAAQAVAIANISTELSARLAKEQAARLMDDLELPVSAVLTEMERAGIAVDVPALERLAAEFNKEVELAANQAYEIIGERINLSSPKQLQEVLFERLGMPKTKKTKTGYTTDAAALTALYAHNPNPFLAAVLRYRDQIKLRQIVEGLLKAVQPDGRIHSVFQQTVAATGRLSSTDPNLQNIPIRTEDGRQIRRCFIAGPGYETLVTADYSQIEMRIMAHLSGDAGLIEAFRTGEDLHRYVGSRVFGVSPADVTPEMRAKVKAMSYGLAYGLSAFGLSQQLDISTSEAQSLMDDYFARFGGVRDYLAEVVETARQTGYTETLLGRRRYLPDLNSDNRQRRAMAERMALNAPIQGSAADIIKLAMLRVRKALADAGLKSREVLQVHDELVLEAAPGEVEQCAEILRTEMGNAIELAVPLDVSVGIGKNWLDAGH